MGLFCWLTSTSVAMLFKESFRIIDARPSVDAVFESQRGMGPGGGGGGAPDGVVRNTLGVADGGSASAARAASRSFSAVIKALFVAHLLASAAKRASRAADAPSACMRSTARG